MELHGRVGTTKAVSAALASSSMDTGQGRPTRLAVTSGDNVKVVLSVLKPV